MKTREKRQSPLTPVEELEKEGVISVSILRSCKAISAQTMLDLYLIKREEPERFRAEFGLENQKKIIQLFKDMRIGPGSKVELVYED